jgi:hypothetical protein
VPGRRDWLRQHTWIGSRVVADSCSMMIPSHPNSDVALYDRGSALLVAVVAGAALVDVPVWKFFLCCLIGDMPYTLIWSYLGSQSQDMSATLNGEKPKSPAKSVLSVVGLLVVIALFVILKKAVQKIMDETTRDLELGEKQGDERPGPTSRQDEMLRDATESRV